MDFFEAVKTRASYRGAYLNKPVPEGDLRRILEAAVCAPSGGNLQSTVFYAVTDSGLRAQLAEVFPTPATKTAPVILAVASRRIPYGPNGEMQFEIEDYAAATENILLAVTALGYAGVWMDGMMKFQDNAEKVRRILGIPEGETPRTIIPIGVPLSPAAPREKAPFSERVRML